MCLKLGLKNGYTLAVSNFKQQFVPQKWPGIGKGPIAKGLVSFSSQTKLESHPFSGLIQIFQRASPTFQCEMSPQGPQSGVNFSFISPFFLLKEEKIHLGCVRWWLSLWKRTSKEKKAKVVIIYALFSSLLKTCWFTLMHCHGHSHFSVERQSATRLKFPQKLI